MHVALKILKEIKYQANAVKRDKVKQGTTKLDNQLVRATTTAGTLPLL